MTLRRTRTRSTRAIPRGPLMTDLKNVKVMFVLETKTKTNFFLHLFGKVSVETHLRQFIVDGRSIMVLEDIRNHQKYPQVDKLLKKDKNKERRKTLSSLAHDK